MQRSLSIWQLAGLTFTAVLGTLLHFLYEWTGLLFLTPFSAVNESTWEHMKILFFPMFFFALFQSVFFRKDYANFWCVKACGISIGVLLIPILFYTYNGAFGTSPAWINVAIFFFSAGVAFYLEHKLFQAQNQSRTSIFPLLFLLLLATLFILFTFTPPKLPLFQDPLVGGATLTATTWPSFQKK